MPEDTGAVKAHMNLATVKNRLESPSSPDYHSPAQFVSDVRLIFRNPAAHQEVGSPTEHTSTLPSLDASPS